MTTSCSFLVELFALSLELQNKDFEYLFFNFLQLQTMDFAVQQPCVGASL
jgi:hypothetical protein